MGTMGNSVACHLLHHRIRGIRTCHQASAGEDYRGDGSETSAAASDETVLGNQVRRTWDREAVTKDNVAAEPLRKDSNPCRDESRPFLAMKRDVLLTVIRSAYEVPPDVVHITLVLYEKERSHLTYETRIYMIVAPADFAKFIVVEPGEYHFTYSKFLDSK